MLNAELLDSVVSVGNLFGFIFVIILMGFFVLPHLVYTACVRGTLLSLIITLLISGLAGLIAPILGISISIMYLCIVPLLTIVHKRKLGTYDGLLYTVVGFGLSVVLIGVYFTLSTGQSIPQMLDAMDTPIKQIFSFSQQMYPWAYGNMDADSYARLFPLVYMPRLLSIYCLGGGLCTYMWSRNRVAKKEIITPMRKFSMLILPRGVVIGMLIVLLASFVGQGINIPNVDIACAVLSDGAGMVFAINGLALLAFILEQKLKYRAVHIIILVLTYMIMGSGLILFGLLGQLMRIRERMINGTLK